MVTGEANAAATGDIAGGFSGEMPRVRRPRIALHVHEAMPWLLLPDGVPVQLLTDAVPVRVPNTRSWFRGVVSQRGNLLPVFDLGLWAGLSPLERKRTMLAAVGQGAQSCALVCVAAPTLTTTSDETPAGDLVDAGALAPYLGEALSSSLGAAWTFDISRWLSAAARQVVGGKGPTTSH